MPSILTKDIEVRLPDFVLVSASAGSGKTTQLTYRLLQLLLSKRIRHNGLQNVLAITFTNNAAAEMKQRTLEYLKRAAIGDKEILGVLGRILALDEDELRRRAENLIGEVLDNYSDFQVQTIDSFLSRVMRSSAVEFGFPPEFDIVFDNAALLDEAFTLFARDLADDRTKRSLVEQLINVLNKQVDSDKKFLWNPYEKLKSEVKGIYSILASHLGVPAGSSRFQTFEEDGQGMLDFGGSSHAPSTVREGIAHEYYIPYLRVYALLSETMEKVQRERRVVDLSLLNKTLAHNVQAMVVPEIYFALGERIHHFLIDEFQDTNPIQWAVLRLLIENSLGGESSLFIVGDTKQAIYTFRGGDWQIMGRMLGRDEFPSVKTQLRTLSGNFRSGRAILDFSKKVFHEYVPHRAPEGFRLSGLADFEQHPEGNKEGYVEVEVFNKDDKRPEKDYLLNVVRDCAARKFAFRDITVLTPKNKDVIEVSSWLNGAGIPFVSHSNLDIRSRKITGEILALLRFLESPIDDLAFASVLLSDAFRAVAENDGIRIRVHEFLFEERQAAERKGALYTLFRQRYRELWDKYFKRLFTVVGYMPLYDLIAEAYKAMSLFDNFPNEEASLVKLLEVVRDFESGGTNSLRDFLQHAEQSEEEDVWDIAVAPGENAVKVMTVHKAKGLGFPVCIVLLYDSQERPENLAVVEEGDQIQLVRVTKKLSEGDPEVERLYTQKQVMRKVDELNKLYVALTRAKDEMYVISVKGGRGKTSTYLPEGGYRDGEKGDSPAPLAKELERLAVLHPATRGFETAKETARLAVDEIKRGEFVHAILQQIMLVARTSGSSAELSKELDAIISTLSPAKFDLSAIKRSIAAILEGGLRPYFTERKGRTVLNEQNVVDAVGKLHRIDRLVIDPDGVTVIDYKTGSEDPEHHEQVSEYVGLVRAIYPGKTVRGILAYIDLNIIREVA